MVALSAAMTFVLMGSIFFTKPCPLPENLVLFAPSKLWHSVLENARELDYIL